MQVTVMMNFRCALLTAVSLFQCAMAVAEFSPIELTVPPSEQCGEHTNPDLAGVVATLTQMIHEDEGYAFLPKSCMEVMENSAASPSGYYTISDGTSGNAAVVYCNMDNLYSCPALEQTLSGIVRNVSTTGSISEDVNTLTSGINCPLFTSCLDVRESCPQCKSGVYHIFLDSNTTNFVTCNFESTYCDVTGPWTKLASWEVSATNSSCPFGLEEFVNGQVHSCGIPWNAGCTAGGCVSLPLFSSPVPYTMVCGRVTGYQKGSTDAFHFNNPNINDPYVDGVSITRGTPRQHVWSYASGFEENMNSAYVDCPCNTNTTDTSPGFVGDDYFCESGCPDTNELEALYTDDPLWDGMNCGNMETACCAPPGQPWFHKVFDSSTTDAIEMRLCITENTYNENVLITSYEFYVL